MTSTTTTTTTNTTSDTGNVTPTTTTTTTADAATTATTTTATPTTSTTEADAKPTPQMGNVIYDCAAAVQPKSPPKPNKIWFDGAVLEALQKRDAAKHACLSSNDDHHAQKKKTTAAAARQAIKKAQSTWLLDLAGAANHNSQRWRAIKEIKKGFGTSISKNMPLMRRPDGSKTVTAEESEATTATHFHKVFNTPSPTSDPKFADSLEQEPAHEDVATLPTVAQVKCKTMAMASGKAPGPDGVTGQMLKILAQDAGCMKVIYDRVCTFWHTQTTDDDWTTATLRLLPKSGDAADLNNWRPISLISLVAKLIAAILADRLQTILKRIGQEEQCGFTPGKGCIDAVGALKTMLLKRKEHGLDTHVLFIDLVKCFDRISRDILFKVLAKAGVPTNLITMTQALYQDCTFVLNGDKIEYTVGVKQGCNLSPVLFLFLMRAAMMTVPWPTEIKPLLFHTNYDGVLHGRKHSHVTSFTTEFAAAESLFADDAAVAFPTQLQLKLGTRVLDRHLEKFGLQMHKGSGPNITAKCKSIALLFSAGPPTPTPTHYEVNGGWVKFATQALYLGATLDHQLTDDPEIDRRLAVASAAFYSLRKEIYGSRKVSLLTKALLYMALVVSMLTYGAELWRLSAAQMRRLESFHRKCVRCFFRISLHHTWTHRITTHTLLQRCKMKSMHDILKQKSLSWLGHVARMDANRLPKLLTFSWVPRTRPVGRPKAYYVHRALRFIKSTIPFIPTNIVNALRRPDTTKAWYRLGSHDAIANWHLVAQDRKTWNHIVDARTPPKAKRGA